MILSSGFGTKSRDLKVKSILRQQPVCSRYTLLSKTRKGDESGFTHIALMEEEDKITGGKR